MVNIGIKVFRNVVFTVVLLTGVLSGTSRGPPRSRLPTCPPGSPTSGVTLKFAHPTECTKFVECWGAQRFVKDCAPGTSFSKRLMDCDYSHNVDDCGVSGVSEVSGYSLCRGVKNYECGRPPTLYHYEPGSSRLDNEAAKNFPWHAAIYRWNEETYQHICGGALIQPNLVLTAAHCFYDSKPEPDMEGRITDYKVAIGKVHKEWDYTEQGVRKRNVLKVWKGSKYMGSEGNWQSDFALVKLDNPVMCVTPVCVDWDESYQSHDSFDTPEGTLVAWGGKRRPGFGRTLHQTSIIPLTNKGAKAHCPALAPKMGERNFVAKGTTKGEPIRRGDSGEVLMFMINGRRFARGIVSSAFSEDTVCTVFTGLKGYMKELKDMVAYAENK